LNPSPKQHLKKNRSVRFSAKDVRLAQLAATEAAIEHGQKLNSSEIKSASVQVKRLHDGIIKCARTTIQSGVEIGGLLLNIKRSIPHGGFIGFVKRNFPFSADTAQRYMNLWRRRDELKRLLESGAGLNEAYALLSPPKGPSPASPSVESEEPELIQESVPDQVKRLLERATEDEQKDVFAWMEARFPDKIIVDVDFQPIDTSLPNPKTKTP
jgi:hypothetical protein